jgi:SpoVK/Ycf46/Vps4 family AAA+-type ATPase
MRRAIQTAESVAPAILWIDEIDKAFSGLQASGGSDGGTASRVFGTFLTWLSEKTAPVFVIATANDISKLPPEFTRAERLDAIFFVDLPGAEGRRAIWDIHLRGFELDPDQRLPRDQDWSGAEIKACCRLAALLDIPLVDAAQHIVPVAVTAGESVERLRNWASGRCLAADRPGIYSRGGTITERAGRNVERSDPSAN